ncbi:MAG: hypothetical protein EOO46_01150 [Flavobacterium sp.]|nr:MAG: hypothetical protein EOO46_01150 [Flavobacterium sp.]
MKNMSRRSFMRKCTFTSISFLPIIKQVDSATEMSFLAMSSENYQKNISNEPFLVDIHCHPTLKYYLLKLLMYQRHSNTKGTNKYNMQVDINNLQKGNVKGILAAHHLPERGMVEQANANRRSLPFLRSVLPLLVDKMEKGDEGNYRQLTYMMDEFEAHVKETNKKKGGDTIFIAKSFQEFKDLIEKGKIAVAQSVEGFHALGRRICDDEYIERLNFLADRGICLMTLSHFFPNDASFPVEGIEPFEKGNLDLNWVYDERYDDRSLTETGKKIVWQMLKRGIVVDLTHMTPKGRKEVFAIHEAFSKQYPINRPLVFSHVGVQENFDDIDGKYAGFRFMGATDDEISKIKECGGVIGIVGENYWLTGNDNHTSSSSTRNYKDGIQYIIDTIKYIYTITQSYDYISIGSDFDGFANSPRDFKNPRYFKNLVERLKKEKISDADIDAITHKNALRVLEAGWGNPV